MDPTYTPVPIPTATHTAATARTRTTTNRRLRFVCRLLPVPPPAGSFSGGANAKGACTDGSVTGVAATSSLEGSSVTRLASIRWTVPYDEFEGAK
jgi:hypothetical protein